MLHHLETTEIINKTDVWYINSLCEKELFTYRSRMTMTKKMIGINTLVPIYINKGLIMFPIYSPRRLDNIWFNYRMINAVYEVDMNKTVIIFRNGVKKTFNISFEYFIKRLKNAETVIHYIETRF